MMTRCPSILLALAIVTLVTGCNSDKKDPDSMSGLSREKEDFLQSQRGNFETSEDPPITANTRFRAGELQEAQGNLPGAIAQYKEAIKSDANHTPSLYRLGFLHTRQREYPQAIDAWQRYIKLTRNNATAYSNLGFCHELAGQPDKAQIAYRDGIAKDPHNQPCRVNYGLMLARRGQINEAVIQFQIVLSQAEVHYNLASVYEQQGRKEQAKAEYDKALQLDPNLVDARTRLGALGE